MSENATVCVFTNQTLAARGVELLPVPARLRARDERGKKIKKITSNPATSDEMKVSSVVSAVVLFPDEVEVLQNASEYARVVEPLQAVTDNKMR